MAPVRDDTSDAVDPADSKLSGGAATFVRFIRRAKSVVEVFPPIGIGLGAGMGIGCGMGWPIRTAWGPPRALCGAGVGIGIGFGYGQGFGLRFGRDARSSATRERIAHLERSIDSAFLAVIVFLRRKLSVLLPRPQQTKFPAPDHENTGRTELKPTARLPDPRVRPALPATVFPCAQRAVCPLPFGPFARK